MKNIKLFEDFNKDYVEKHLSQIDINDTERVSQLLNYQKKNGGLISIPPEASDLCKEYGYEVRTIEYSDLEKQEYIDAMDGGKVNYVVIIKTTKPEIINIQPV
jgi:hypothetical protein